VEAKGPDVLEASRWVIDVAGPGLAYSDPRVRAITLEAVLKALNAFREQIREPNPPVKLPPPDRKLLTPAERKIIQDWRDTVQADEKLYRPIVLAIRKQARPLARLLTDPDPKVRLEVRKALEAVGDARLRMQRLAASVPALPDQG